jgi:hypothetical protein
MTGTSAAAWVGMTAATGGQANPEALLGMLGPLASADASWLVMVRAYASGPERLMGRMVQALAVKMIWFGAYVVAVVSLFDLRPIPFIASFTGFFIGLYLMEAIFLRRLLKASTRPQSG